MPGGFGTSPFDGEGVPTRRTVVIENGVLKSYLLNTYTAKKLGLQTTANASRGLAGTPGIGPGNYFLQPGTKTPQELIAEIKEGLYVTEFLGHGAIWSPETIPAAPPASGFPAENSPIPSKRSPSPEI